MKKVTKGFLEDMTSYCVKHAYHIMINLAEEKLAELDLKVPDFSILAMVHLNPGITQSKLIENLYVTRSTASELVEKLVSRDLIYRKPINRKASGLLFGIIIGSLRSQFSLKCYNPNLPLGRRP